MADNERLRDWEDDLAEMAEDELTARLERRCPAGLNWPSVEEIDPELAEELILVRDDDGRFYIVELDITLHLVSSKEIKTDGHHS